MLSHLDGDRQPALRLFGLAGQLAGLLEITGASSTAATTDPTTAKEQR
jgi:hypothetical protein